MDEGPPAGAGAAAARALRSAECEGTEDDTECPVCFAGLLEPAELPCAHILCKRCLRALQRRGAVRCPLCRADVPADFRPPTVAPARCAELARRALALHGEDTASEPERGQCFLRYGNRHARVANPKRSAKGRHLNEHRWTAFVELVDENGDVLPAREAAARIESVRFGLAPYYTVWPASDRRSLKGPGGDPIVTAPPFEVERIGWGYFELPITVKWKPVAGVRLPATVVDHELCFENDGLSQMSGAPESVPGPQVAMTARPPTAPPPPRRGGRPRWR